MDEVAQMMAVMKVSRMFEAQPVLTMLLSDEVFEMAYAIMFLATLDQYNLGFAASMLACHLQA